MISRAAIEGRFGIPISVDLVKRGHGYKDGSHEYRYNCPFCLENRGDPDTKGHLFVNDRLGVYHCYRCGASGRIQEENSEYSTRELIDNSELLKDLSLLVSDNSDEVLDMVIPRKKALDDGAAKDYLNSRGFTDEVIDYYDMRVGSVFSNLLGHVVIPNVVRHQVMTDMYCARSFIGSNPKYKNPPASRASHIVYNLHRIKDYPSRIIICEGALNAIAAGKNAVALYGKECSEVKLSKILAKHPSQIVVNLDYDAQNKAYELADRIRHRDRSIEVKILLINNEKYKDAADYLQAGRIDEYREMIETCEVYNPMLSDLVKLLGDDIDEN